MAFRLFLRKLINFLSFKLVFSFSHKIFNHVFMWCHAHTLADSSTQGSPENFKFNIKWILELGLRGTYAFRHSLESSKWKKSKNFQIFQTHLKSEILLTSTLAECYQLKLLLTNFIEVLLKKKKQFHWITTKSIPDWLLGLCWREIVLIS